VDREIPSERARGASVPSRASFWPARTIVGARMWPSSPRASWRTPASACLKSAMRDAGWARRRRSIPRISSG
jgi:hypothetical protein